MKAYIKFYLVALGLLALPYYMAFISDGWGTMIMSFPAFLFFISSFFFYGVQAIRKKDIKINDIKCLSSLILLVSLIIPFILSQHGIGELTEKRVQIINELKPVFVRYYSENGCYPVSLEDLVPEYIEAIPKELINDGKKDPYKKIYYELMCGEPKFHFHTIRGPDSSASLNVVTGEYWHDT